jgi:hypothetical protein
MWGKAFAWAAIASSLACGGGSSSSTGACSTVAACGGDIVGTWKVVSVCGKATGTITGPGGCTISVSDMGLNASGTYTLNADGTYVVDVSISESDTFVFGPACLSTNGVTQTCAQLASALDTTLIPTNSQTTISAWTCSPSLGGCSCNASIGVSNGMASGTYTTAGGAVTVTPSGAMAETTGYCVQGGSKLYIIDVPSMATAMSGITVRADLVLTKE